MPPAEPTDEERQQQLPQDGDTPFQPAGPNPSPTGNTTDPVVEEAGSQEIAVDHPETDSNLEAGELYDEGLSGAAETEDNSRQSAVTDYTPPEADDAEEE